jgi:hypothetical protein
MKEHEEECNGLYAEGALRKRVIIESVNEMLKNVYEIKHTRHRNLITNLLSGLNAYSLPSSKPSVKNAKLTT